MLHDLHLYAEDLTVEQVRSLVPRLLPYGMKFVEVRPVIGELYDYILTVKTK